MTGRQMNGPDTAVFGCDLEHPAALATRYGLRAALPCRRSDADAWFPESGALRRDEGYAARLCAGCPVLAACREWAMATRQAYGVWGGQSEATRERLLRRRGTAPAAPGHDRPALTGRCPVSTLTALIGPPGSGKSTYALTLPAFVLSSDALRAELGRGPGDQSVSDAAFALLRRRAGRMLTAGSDVVIDATNAATPHRRRLLTLAGQSSARPLAVLLVAPLAVCLARNADRPADQRVPEDRVRRYWRAVSRLAPDALLAEGWAAVRVLDERGALLGVWRAEDGAR